MPLQLQIGQDFPDLSLPDHTGQTVTLSQLIAPDEFSRKIGFSTGRPLIIVFYRGFFCPRDRVQLSQLVGFYREIELNQARLVAISADAPLVAAAYRAGLGAQFLFLSDQERLAITQLGIVDKTDGEYQNVAIPYTFCLTPNLRIHTIYNGWWLAGRPTLEELRQDLRAIRAKQEDYEHAAWDTPTVKAVRVPAAYWAGQTDAKTWRTVGQGRGRVRWFARGQGVIASETGEELFVHFTGIPGQGDRTLAPGTMVVFEIAEGKYGRHAVEVRAMEGNKGEENV